MWPMVAQAATPSLTIDHHKVLRLGGRHAPDIASTTMAA
jgi:hypothetical protein